jgi:hypothetical protein
MLFDRRYNFGAMDGFFGGYTDRRYYAGMLYPGRGGRSGRAVYEEWLAATNLLTTAKARDLAAKVVEAAGLFGVKHGFTGQPEVLQEPDEEHDLAYYRFEWKNEESHTRFSVEVSGITGTVVHFSMYGPFLRLYRPPDYLELLGLSTNTVFVTKNRVPPGLPQTYEIYGSNLPTPLVEWK